jgi:ribosome biogenesis GTPase
VLIQCEHAGIEGIVVINKCDLHDALTPEIERRLAGYAALGYTVLRVSAKTGAGLDVLRAALVRKTSVFTGHSGAGKSSLINALFPSAHQKTGELAAKYDRGAHTTVMAALFDGLLDGENAAIIDTPGLRRFVPDGLDRRALVRSMRDLSPLAERCLYGASCTHTSENGCALLAALCAGTLCPDRWATCQNLRESLPERR